MLREGREPLAGAKEEYSFYLKLGAGTLGARPESPCLTGSQGTGAEAGDSTEGNQEEEQQCSVTEKPKTVCNEPKGRTCPWVLGTALEDLIRPRRTGSGCPVGRGAPEMQGGPTWCSQGKTPALGKGKQQHKA